ncbi:PTPN23 [Lepeophtheirus salmonis]|uniref:PTPN23 n=1 Tax=Lepeophtheirus salmonis TaxID=72036 RepID=A0A7R8CCS5_LEPSM|nr:PTPN23 [Lepeophtheirus salmonis]CAF2772411.1 PTPN23 [Lepeophtheirus salmonis]
MEGVPRLPMLKCELKRSPDNEGISSRLRELIRGRYGETGFEEEIREFETLRAHACIRVSKDVSGIAEVKKYYAQLSFLKNRLELDPDDEEGGIPWSWYTLYNDSNPVIVAFNDISLEMSSVLYNSGALHSILASEEPRISSEEMKMACTHFQCAAWAFHIIPDRCTSIRSTDIDSDVLAFLSQVCLAQAQECILEKSILDHRKATIVAKVGAQVVDYYLQAKRKIDGSFSKNEEENIYEIVGSKLAKLWLHYRLKKWGERVAYLEAASNALKTASSKGKSLVSSSLASEIFDKALIGSALSFSSDVINGKFDNAKKENEFVYHESVPDINTLPELKGASLFQSRHMSQAHCTLRKKQKLLRTVGDEIEKKDSELAVFLASLSLDEIPEPGEQEYLPPELIECVAGLSVKKDAISKLAEAMKQIDTVTCSVDSAIEQLKQVLEKEDEEEKEFQALLGEKRTSHLNVDLKRELDTFIEARAVASESTSTLHNAMQLHLENFNLLGKPLEELEKIVPSMKDLDEESEHNIDDILLIYNKVKEMKSQRIFLLDKLRDEIQSDDITKKLILYKNKDLSEVFSTELKKHDSVIQLIRTNLGAQSNILQIFADTNAKCVDTRCTVSKLLSARKDLINSLVDSYHTYDDLLHKTAKGLQFYDKLESNVSKALSKAKGVVKVQSEERDALIAKNMPSPNPNFSVGPRLNNFNPIQDNKQVYQATSVPQIPSQTRPLPSEQNKALGEEPSPISKPTSTNESKVSAPLHYSQSRATYTSGTEASNNMTLATASPQIQQQEQHRQYYQPPSSIAPPPNSSPFYQYPTNIPSSSSNSINKPGTEKMKPYSHPQPSGHPSGISSYPPNQSNYYGQNYGTANTSQVPPNPQYFNSSQNQTYLNQIKNKDISSSDSNPPQVTEQKSNQFIVQGNYQLNNQPYPSYNHQTNQYPYNYSMPCGEVVAPANNTLQKNLGIQYPTTLSQPYSDSSTQNLQSSATPAHLIQQRNPFLATTTNQMPQLMSQYPPQLNQPSSYVHTSNEANYNQSSNLTQQQQFLTQQYGQQAYSGQIQSGYNYNHGASSVGSVNYNSYSSVPAFSNTSSFEHRTSKFYCSVSQIQHRYTNNVCAIKIQCISINKEVSKNPISTTATSMDNGYSGGVTPVLPSNSNNEANYKMAHVSGVDHSNANNLPSSGMNSNFVHPLNPVPVNCTKNIDGRESSVDKILNVSPEEPKKGNQHKGSCPDPKVLKPKVMTASDLEEEKEVAKITKEINHASAHDPFESSENLRNTLFEETNTLESIIKDISSPNSTSFEKIWKDIKTQFEKGPVLKISVARCYPMKNRDADVLPYDHNRVELPSTKDDYINASHIKGLTQHSPRYIATQSPTSGTLSDFWTMVWQEQVETVINLVPEDTHSIFIYWPIDCKIPIKVGSLEISLQSSKNEVPFLTEKLMTIMNNFTNTSRVVIFIQATKQVNTLSLLLDVACLLLKYHRQQRVLTHPIVVHCQVGSGKTASVIILSSCLSEINVGSIKHDENGLASLVPLPSGIASHLMRQRKGVLKDKESLKMKPSPQPLLETKREDPHDLSKIMDEISLTDSSSPIKKITKQDFLKPIMGLNPDMKSNDPLSQLDPLWSLKLKS